MAADLLVAVCMLTGATLVLVSALGLTRMPDLLLRMHATSKATTLGATLILAAAAIDFSAIAVTTRVLAIVAFLFLTAPLAAHLLARVSYFLGIPLSHHTVLDELAGKYDHASHVLAGADALAGTKEAQGPTGQSARR